jgi:hypothetical protein
VSIAEKLECSIRQLNTWRKAIGFVDPRIPVDGRANRLRSAVPRVEYYVRRADGLWHMDA